MKRLIIAVALLAAFLAPALPQTKPGADAISSFKARIKKFRNSRRFAALYDKFKDETQVSVGPFLVSGTMEYMASNTMIGVMAAFRFEGHSPDTKVPGIYLAFTSSSGRWQFLKDRSIYALVDGERVKLGDGAHDSNIGYGSVGEVLSIGMSRETFDKIANGKSVEVKVGGREIKLKDEHLQAFKDLSSLAQR